MRRVVDLILVVLVVLACGRETQSSTPSFMAFEHEHGGQYTYINMLIDHVHDETWHIPYSATVERNFEPAISAALQMWLQPLRDTGARGIVDDFEFHPHAEEAYPSDVPWDEVLFRVVFSTESRGAKKGEYVLPYVPKGTPVPTLQPDQLPRLYVYEVEQSKEDFVTDFLFMFVLVHEMGHAFGLADTYQVAGGAGRRGNQPVSVMSADYHAVLASGNEVKLTDDDVKGVVWLYKKHHTESIASSSDCHFNDYQHETTPAGCVPKGIAAETESQPPPTEPPPTTAPPPTRPPPTEPATETAVDPPTPAPPLSSCTDDPCATACLTSCRYRSCGSSYANPSVRYRTSCYSRDDGQWCGSAGQGRNEVCRTKSSAEPAEEASDETPADATTAPSCADDPCATACLTGCRYRSCGSSYANPSARYRTSCYSRDDGQWCGSAGQGRNEICEEPAEASP